MKTQSAASVKARLMNRAKATGKTINILDARYLSEKEINSLFDSTMLIDP